MWPLSLSLLYFVLLFQSKYKRKRRDIGTQVLLTKVSEVYFPDSRNRVKNLCVPLDIPLFYEINLGIDVESCRKS